MPRAGSDEDGSVMIAMIVTLVLSLLLVALLQVVGGAMTSSRVDQNRNNAFQFASAGIDHALYRIDAGDMPLVAQCPTPTGPRCYTPTITSGRVTSFTDRITVNGPSGASTYDIVAGQFPITTPPQTTQWRVRATGRDPSGKLRQAVTTISALPTFENGFFVDSSFYLSGNQTSPIAYHSSTCIDPRPPTPAASTNCNILPVPAYLGTNGTFTGSTATVTAFATKWLGWNMYGKSTQAAAEAACNGCPPPQVNAISESLKTTVPPPPTAYTDALGVQWPKPCPNNGSIGKGSATPADPYILTPGDYVCDVKVSFFKNVAVDTTPGAGNGTGQVRIWIRNSLSMASNSVLNQAQVPARLQLFQPKKQPGNTAWPGSVCGAQIWALLHTPGLDIGKCGGSNQPEIFGAVVANKYVGTGDHFKFHWDIDSRFALNDGKYRVKDWRECPPSLTDC